jgi:acetyl-CoA carboxylase biotin carboxyl carrier protein
MKELLELVSAKGLGSLEVRQGDFCFRIGSEAIAVPSVDPPVAREASSAVPVAAEAPAEPAVPDGHVVSSPIVGTFYSSPSPDAEPYVRVGDRVRQGQVLCIVEAMKLMNEIESDADGLVVKVFPDNAQPVEFGEPLFCIQTD